LGCLNYPGNPDNVELIVDEEEPEYSYYAADGGYYIYDDYQTLYYTNEEETIGFEADSYGNVYFT